MAAATSKDIALSVLVLLPFDVVTTVLRFWIRYRRKAWGADDWAMLVNLPFWTISIIALLGMSYSGIGAPDASLSEQEVINSLRWFYIFQEPWCFTLITIKWSLGFTLLRIANKKRWVEVVIYTCLTLVTLTMGGTGMYLFFQCLPVQKNWFTSMDGACQPRSIQTALSFLVAAVSISTDWIFAVLPIFLLWNVQIDKRVKLSVVGLLSLGIFASIAPLIRLNFLLGMNDPTKFLQNLGPILAWASAEMNVGMLIANLPACRPLLEKALARFTSLTGSRSRTGRGGKPSMQYPAGTSGGVARDYVELEDGRGKGPARPMATSAVTKPDNVGIETRIYGRELGGSDESLGDDGSERRFVPDSGMRGTIHVQTDFNVE